METQDEFTRLLKRHKIDETQTDRSYLIDFIEKTDLVVKSLLNSIEKNDEVDDKGVIAAIRHFLRLRTAAENRLNELDKSRKKTGKKREE